MARSATSSMVSVAGDTPLLEISVAFSACERASSQSLNPWIQGINKWSNQAEEALTIASVWFSQTAAFLPYNALCLWWTIKSLNRQILIMRAWQVMSPFGVGVFTSLIAGKSRSWKMCSAISTTLTISTTRITPTIPIAPTCSSVTTALATRISSIPTRL